MEKKQDVQKEMQFCTVIEVYLVPKHEKAWQQMVIVRLRQELFYTAIEVHLVQMVIACLELGQEC